MHFSSRFLTALFAAGALAACASSGTDRVTVRPERVGSCAPETSCELAGQMVLQAEPGSYNTATIDQAQSACVPMLVSETLFASSDRWDGKAVRAGGTALARVRSGPDVTRVKYRDRWLIEGVCENSEIVLYVDRIALEK